MTSKNNSDEWTSTANRRSSSSGTSAMHPNSPNEQIQIIEATTDNGMEKKRLLLYRHPSSNENNLQPYFAHSSSLLFMTDDGNSISNFWITSLQMSCVNSYSLFRSSKQVRTDFVTADGCESLCASEVLLHPSICFTYSNKHRNNNNNTTTTKSNNYKVIALSQHDISTNNNNDKVVIRTIAQLIANWWVTSNTLPAKPKSTNKATSIKPLVSVSHSNISTTTTTYGKSFLSTVSWAATKLLSKFDLMDDPQEAQELQSCVELLQKDRDQISKRNNTMDSNVLVVPASSYSTTTSTANEDGTTLLLLSVDLIGHCCQYLLDRLPNADTDAILGQNNDFYSYYYKNTIRPQIILHMHPSSSSSELISFWKFCQLAGTTTTTHSQQQQQPNHNTEDDHYFELSTAVPQLLSHISKDDSYLLFHVLNSSGKIHKDNNNDDDTVVVFVPEDGSFREVDVAIFRLLHAQWKVEQRVATYTQQYTELGIRAVSIKKQQQQQAAIHLMKQRKIVESEIDKSQQIIFNLEQTKLHLEQAYTNKELTNIFELCRDAMKNTNTTTDLSIVEDVMLDLEEEMEQVQELTVATSSAPSNNYYELEDLERELAGLAIAAPPLKQVKSATSTASREETNVVDKVDTASRISKESTPTLVDCTSDAAVSSNEIEESVEPSNTKDVPSSLELLLA